MPIPVTIPFPTPTPGLDLEALRIQARTLASQGVFVGTSSWKYPGWRGLLYDFNRYVYRGKFSETRFERQCLTEYSEVLKTVCVDAAYYKYPDPKSLRNLAAQVPTDFLFGFKVTDEITLKRFPNLPRFGPRAGQANPHFLDATRFIDAFLGPCDQIRSQVGVLMFEFSHFHPSDFARGRDFVAALDSFLARLPTEWPYGVEIRNRSFLHPDYFAVLRAHGVTHVLNSWEGMPPIHEQSDMPGVFTTPDRIVARFLLRPGRAYAQAVEMFSPYCEVRDPYPEARATGAQLIRKTNQNPSPNKRTLLFVNNRLEGNALHTLQAMIEQSKHR